MGWCAAPWRSRRGHCPPKRARSPSACSTIRRPASAPRRAARSRNDRQIDGSVTTAPFTAWERGSQRNAIASATSSSFTHRERSTPGMARSFCGVRMIPGATQLARTPEVAPSSASALVSAITPALAAAYAEEPPMPESEATLEAATLTIRPPSGPNLRTAARPTRKALRRLEEIIDSNTSTEVSFSGEPPLHPPAQFTAAHRPEIPSNPASTDRSSVSSTARSSGARFVCTNGTTRAPSCARRAHTARPRFPEAPVTTTDLPARSMELLLDSLGQASQIHALDGQPAEARPALRRAALAHRPVRRKLPVRKDRAPRDPALAPRPAPVPGRERAAFPPAPAGPPARAAAATQKRLAATARALVRCGASQPGLLPDRVGALDRRARRAPVLAHAPLRVAPRAGAPAGAARRAHRARHADRARGDPLRARLAGTGSLPRAARRRPAAPGRGDRLGMVHGGGPAPGHGLRTAPGHRLDADRRHGDVPAPRDRLARRAGRRAPHRARFARRLARRRLPDPRHQRDGVPALVLGARASSRGARGGLHQPAAAGHGRARPRLPGRARHAAVHRRRAGGDLRRGACAAPRSPNRRRSASGTCLDHEIVRADGLAAVRLGALRRLLQQPVQVAVQRLEGVAGGIAARLLEDALRLAHDYERLLPLLRHVRILRGRTVCSPSWSDRSLLPR